RIGEVRARVAPAHETLAHLHTLYPQSALASVAQNPDQATQLLAGAEEVVTSARQSIESDDRATAVVRLRAAQHAVQQAAEVLDAVDSAGADLAAAGPKLEAALVSISSDVSDAARLAPSDGGVTIAVEDARRAI